MRVLEKVVVDGREVIPVEIEEEERKDAEGSRGQYERAFKAAGGKASDSLELEIIFLPPGSREAVCVSHIMGGDEYGDNWQAIGDRGWSDYWRGDNP
jgi:hypothetical protein